ncbi:FAD-dependent monooxygenase [Arthrobacter sp. ES3-54]|uniref:FAD-dependent monooxygenase n=1 Tax=Arthrobacter sp. ES3-54 TaxID=1502991 RepID=UPI002406AA44|nr:FAD-dependent monooxygenase [Arthrobacter sp. ES3-54]MDF9749536.1 2-polyprenyl-6-methoxyphenol hydroxylase-like FAD-dependent oxidoreductase [Arthrobacter sp. ES3-54]
MNDHAVKIAGGAPTGLMLAGELALAKVDVAVVERRPNQDLTGSRAGGLHSHTIEILDQRGIADRFLAEGQKAQVAAFGGTQLDISDIPTRHNYELGLWQKHIERLLAGWVGELGVHNVMANPAETNQWADLLAITGQLYGPPAGTSTGRPRAEPTGH